MAVTAPWIARWDRVNTYWSRMNQVAPWTRSPSIALEPTHVITSPSHWIQTQSLKSTLNVVNRCVLYLILSFESDFLINFPLFHQYACYGIYVDVDTDIEDSFTLNCSVTSSGCCNWGDISVTDHDLEDDANVSVVCLGQTGTIIFVFVPWSQTVNFKNSDTWYFVCMQHATWSISISMASNL